MNIRCLGGWVEGVQHEPTKIGTKEPITDSSFTDGVCDRCCRTMAVTITCRWCSKAETHCGICADCLTILTAWIGEPALELTIFRTAAEPVTGSYDGAGVVSRLRTAMKQPTYLGFALRALVVAR